MDHSPVDEPVHLEPYSRQWPKLFETEAARILSSLQIPSETVEHIGSTAVPGLVSKPVIDIQLGVPSYPPAKRVGVALQALGYEALGEAGVPGRQYYRIRSEHAFNVHIVALASSHWRRNIALRDYLRRSRVARDAYAQAKSAAIASGATTLLLYSSAKAGVVQELLSQAVSGHNDA